MKILALADEECKSLWDFYDPARLEGLDLIISCGDLKATYLEFLVTMGHCPVLYVCGNHDSRYMERPPEGCICIEDRVYDYKGLRILGLGGSMRYKPGPYMYTEKEMQGRIQKVRRDILLKNGFDVLVTHAPARGYGDMDDLPHIGYECFNDMLMKYHPKYMLHGHVHKSYSHTFQRVRHHESGTTIINAYENYRFEIGEDEYPKEGHTGSPLYDLMVNMKQARYR